MEKKPKNTVYMGKRIDLLDHNPSWYLNINDLCTHVLVCGGDNPSRTTVTKRLVDGAHMLRRKLVVVSATGSWSDVKLGGGTITSDFDSKRVSAMLGGRSTSNVVLEIGEDSPSHLNSCLASMFDSMFSTAHRESDELKLLVVLDGVYDVLLDALGPRCSSILFLERGVREFRKWGVGILLATEKLSRLTEGIMANLWTIVHLGSSDPNETRKSSLYFRGESPRLAKLRLGEALAISPNYWYSEPFRLKLR
jgi:hypothetical protein